MLNTIPVEAISVYNKALDLSSKGDLSNALSEYNKALTMYPTFLEAYNNIGEIYSKMGNSEKAISTYQLALAIERHYRVLLNIGVEYFNRGEYESALSHFAESINLKDDFIDGHHYAGLSYFSMRDYVNSERHFARVVSYDIHHVKANSILAYIYYEWKQYEKSIECLDRIASRAEDQAFIFRYYGFCHYHLGHYDQAIGFFTQALESSPKYQQFSSYLKSLTIENKMREIGDIDAAIRDLESKMEKERPSIREYARLSLLYIFKGENKKAEILLTGYRSKQ